MFKAVGYSSVTTSFSHGFILTKLCFFQYEESKVTEAEMLHTALTHTSTLGEEESGTIKIPFFCEVYKTLGYNSVSIN